MNPDNSISAIKKFMEVCNASDGKKIEVFAEAYCGPALLYQDDATIYCNYNYGYMQYGVSIYWRLNDDSMHELGLYGNYNTNFQDFSFSDDMLIIVSDDIKIFLTKE